MSVTSLAPGEDLRCTGKQRIRLAIVKMVHDSGRDGQIEVADAFDGFRRDSLDAKRSAVPIAELCGFDVFRLRIKAVVIHIMRNVGKQIGGAASDVENAVPWLDPHKIGHIAVVAAAAADNSPEQAVDPGT